MVNISLKIKKEKEKETKTHSQKFETWEKIIPYFVLNFTLRIREGRIRNLDLKEDNVES